MSIHQISFLPIARADVPLVSQWLATPHVARWWADDASPDAIEADCGACIDGAEPCEVFVVHFDNKPMGLIQRYRFDAYPQYTDELAHMLAVPDIAFSIDYFIGPESALQRGWGSAMILAFVGKLWQDDPMASCLIVPTQAGNRTSWRAFIIFARHVEAKR